jgi:hypothetical protein
VKRITVEMLKEHNACASELRKFRKVFPTGAPVSLRSLAKAQKAGLDVFFAERFLTGQAWAEYEKVRRQAWAEYEKVRRPAGAEYQKVTGQALEYEKVAGPAWAEYEKVRRQAGAEYQKVRRQAGAEYQKVTGQALIATLAAQGPGEEGKT